MDPNKDMAYGSTVATISYDGLGRRISKQTGDGHARTTELGDGEATYQYYYDNWRMVETRDGDGNMIRRCSACSTPAYLAGTCLLTAGRQEQSSWAGRSIS